MSGRCTLGQIRAFIFEERDAATEVYRPIREKVMKTIGILLVPLGADSATTRITKYECVFYNFPGSLTLSSS
jgi:hypothetical protein